MLGVWKQGLKASSLLSKPLKAFSPSPLPLFDPWTFEGFEGFKDLVEEGSRKPVQSSRQPKLQLKRIEGKTWDSFVPTPSATTSSPSDLVGSACDTGVAQNKAKKYLPALSVIDHQGRGKGHERSRVLAQFSGNTQLVACFAG